MRSIPAALGCALLWAAAASEADSPTAVGLKIGVVNATVLMDKAPQVERARSKLEGEFAARNQQLIAAQKRVKGMEEALAQGGVSLEDGARRKLERDLLAERRELKRSQEEFKEDFNIRRNEELGRLQEQISEAIRDLAKARGFDVILLNDAVVFASERADLTAEVLKHLK
jgi:outer membrane protein